MSSSRKVLYAAMLLSFYTFVTVFSLRINFLEIFVPVILINLLSYAWFLILAARHGPLLVDYKDLIMQIFIYCFISFFIVFSSLIFLEQEFRFLRILLLESPIVIWIIIWTDFYFYKTKARV